MSWVQQNSIKGPKGPTGPVGPKGSTGLKGATGATGWDWGDTTTLSFKSYYGAGDSYSRGTSAIIELIGGDKVTITGRDPSGAFTIGDRMSANLYQAVQLKKTGWYLFYFTYTITNNAIMKLWLEFSSSESTGYSIDEKSFMERQITYTGAWNSTNFLYLKYCTANQWVRFVTKMEANTSVWVPNVGGSITAL